MQDTITVWHDGMALLLFKSIAERHGLVHGSRVSTEQFWEVLKDNCDYGIALCNASLDPVVN